MEPWLYNVTVLDAETFPYHSEWMPGVSYSEVLLKCRHKWPHLGPDNFVIEKGSMSWAQFLQRTQSDTFN